MTANGRSEPVESSQVDRLLCTWKSSLARIAVWFLLEIRKRLEIYLAREVNMNRRIAAAILFGVGIASLSGCAPWVNDAIHFAEDVKKTSDGYEQEKHEERVEEFNTEYEEFVRSQGKPEPDTDESEQSIVIMKDDIESD